MRFAKLGEEVYQRQSELVGEELRLYIIIFFHTWVDSQKCNKNLRELCQIYKLDYDNSCRRLKSLRQKEWVENTKKFIRPLIGFKTVNPTVQPEKTVNPTVGDDVETVNSTVSNCNNYSEIGTETVNSTVPLIPYIEPFKDEIFPDTTHGEKTAGGSVENNKNLSKFSLEECLSYTLECQMNGDDIRNPRALAVSLHKSGIADAFIEARLYPHRHAPKADARFNEQGEFVPQPLTDRQRDYYLENLASFSDEEFDEDEWRGHFTPDDWAWLKGKLQNAG